MSLYKTQQNEYIVGRSVSFEKPAIRFVCILEGFAYKYHTVIDGGFKYFGKYR